MRHAVLLGGKRMRPLLVYASGDSCSAPMTDVLDAPATAVELIHAYSLVHDDLPAMDDDALRRGQPTVHVAFDEATAILAGDALQSLAFEVLAGTEDRRRDTRRAAAHAGRRFRRRRHVRRPGAGPGGDRQRRALPVAELERLHALKTGALIRAAVRMGALCGHAGDDDSAAPGPLRRRAGPGLPGARRHPRHRRRQRHARQDRGQGRGAGQGHVSGVDRPGRVARAAAGTGCGDDGGARAIRRTR